MAAPTAAVLLDRLRKIHEEQVGHRLSDEKLAARLPIGLSTLNRWKKGDTQTYEQIVAMLDEAGWITTDAKVPQSVGRAAVPVDHQAEIAAALKDLLAGQREILARLPPGEADAPPQARPKP